MGCWMGFDNFLVEQNLHGLSPKTGVQNFIRVPWGTKKKRRERERNWYKAAASQAGQTGQDARGHAE